MINGVQTDYIYVPHLSLNSRTILKSSWNHRLLNSRILSRIWTVFMNNLARQGEILGSSLVWCPCACVVVQIEIRNENNVAHGFQIYLFIFNNVSWTLPVSSSRVSYFCFNPQSLTDISISQSIFTHKMFSLSKRFLLIYIYFSSK